MKNGKVMTEEEAKGVDWAGVGKSIGNFFLLPLKKGYEFLSGLFGPKTSDYFTKVPITNVPEGESADINNRLDKGKGWAPYGEQNDDKYAAPHFADYLARVIWGWYRKYPNYPMYINDISRPGGGEFPPHVTHRTGESVDIKFFTKDGKLHPEYPNYYNNPYYDRKLTEEFIIFAIKNALKGMKFQRFFNDIIIVNDLEGNIRILLEKIS
ncbi:hypothetical protein [Thermospira aquatica]|uniref:Uncharacterized protein n=1 Tax=Thermospira aquatica TaxID=2828656 RepID=A0AAX3BE64_9SPIR|nr:hypothetical protein [Thermospira aquatica]URA10577.1 hypothetical protein KDW03_01890 [Thermospira aquatica]